MSEGVLTKAMTAAARTLTAAAVRLGGEDRDTAPASSAFEWQRRILAFYDENSFARYPAQFYARHLSKLRLFPAVRKDNGEIEEIEDNAAREIMDRIRDPGGGDSQWKSQYARLRFLIGECYLACTGEGQEGEFWEVLSPTELRWDKSGKRFVRIQANQQRAEYPEDRQPLDEAASEGAMRVWRLWNPHPAHSQLPDSSMRAALEHLELLMLCSGATRARLRSRLAGSGVLAIDSSINLPAPDVDEDDEDPKSDPLFEQIIEHFEAPIQNPGSSSAIVPYLLKFDAGGRAISDLIAHIAIHDPTAYPELEVAEKLVRFLAMGIDIPPEELLGMGKEGNHWSAWKVDEQSWEIVRPMCQSLVDDLTGAYFQPACREAKIENWKNMVVGYDAAEIVSHPNRGKDVLEVYREMEASGDALRAAFDLTEDDAPDEEERRYRLAISLSEPSLLPEGLRPAEPEAPEGGEQVVEEPPNEEEAEQRRVALAASGNGHDDLPIRLLAAAEMAVSVARSRAGARLRSRERSCQECFEGVEAPNGALAAALGPETVARLGDFEPEALVAGGSADFVEAARRWGVADRKAFQLGEGIERYAAATLYEASIPSISEELRELVLTACWPDS